MQKDMVPSWQKRFIAEKSQKEIVQKGAEMDKIGQNRPKNLLKTAPGRLGSTNG